MHKKFEMKMENYSVKITQLNKCMPIILRLEDLSKMDQDELNIIF